ncbi:DUF6449 domain-containing protein [Lachnospiraceae bacterium C1.1]|nr:DUF6449 domain-containing protein [Lachnospiraceae bacterium C1.1]
MTSEKLSPDKIFKFQKNLLRERNWQFLLVLLLFMIYYIGGSATAVFFARLSSNDIRLNDHLKTASSMLFGPYLIPFALYCMAIVAAMSGYAYLYNRQKVDFYESQPVGRGFRWWNIFFSGIYIVFIPYFFSSFIGYIFMSVIGYTDTDVLLIALSTMLKASVLYLAVYSFTILSTMLCGHIVIAFMGTIVLMVWYDDLKLIFNGLASILFATYTDYSLGFDPLKNFSPNPVSNFVLGKWQGTLTNLGLALILAVLAYLIYLKRKNEMLGCAIAFKTARLIIKISIATIITINISWFYLMAVEDSINLFTLLFIGSVIIVTAILSSMFMEGILSFNVKSCLKRFSNSFIVMGIALLVFLGFYFDIFGYDRYLPSENSVASYALIRDNYISYYDKDSLPINQQDYAYKYMFLTDGESMHQLAAIATENSLQLKKSREAINGYTVTVIYRLKSGLVRSRELVIPYDVDENLMNKVLGSEEYKDGYFPYKHDEILKDYFNQKLFLNYSLANSSKELDHDILSKYEELRKAYDKDLLSYDFTLTKRGIPMGSIKFGSEYDSSTDDYHNFSIEFPVYENYSNTIEFLKDNNLWIDNKVKPYMVNEAQVEYYNSEDTENIFGNYSSDDYYEDNYYEETEGNTKTYTNFDQITELYENTYISDLYENWDDPRDDENKYIVTFYYGDVGDDNFSSENCKFITDSIPSFVKDDFAGE